MKPVVGNTFRQSKPEEPRTTQYHLVITQSEGLLMDDMSSRLHMLKAEFVRYAIGEYIENHGMNL